MDTSGLGTAAKALFAALSSPGAGEALGVEGWLDVLSGSQEAMNVLSGVQAVAMAQVAAYDVEDSGLGERRHRGLGHVALDAPDLVAASVGCSAQSAAARVGMAVTQVRAMPALVSAMGAGRVDGFRAAVVADELVDAPAEVQSAIAEELDRSGRLDAETAGPLRRRARRLLAERAPEVLAERAASERERRGLHRSTAALGVEHWAAWLPVESSRPAWAAVTGLAQRYLRAGQADNLAQARADAMTDLILGQATGTFVLHPTVPLEDLTDPATGGAGREVDDLVPVGGFGTPGETFVRRGHLRELAWIASRPRPGWGTGVEPGAATSAAGRRSQVRVGECLALDPETGALLGILDSPTHDGPGEAFVWTPRTRSYRPSAEVERVVKARDARCRFPGCQVPVRFCDLDHVVAFDHAEPGAGGPTAAGNLACLCRRHHRIKQRPGWHAVLHPDGTMTWTDPTGRVRTSWPADHRHLAGPDHSAPDAVVALPPAPLAEPRPGSWATERRARELEPYSVLEDQFLDVLIAGGVDVSPVWTVHRLLPTPRRCRRAGGDLEEEPEVPAGSSPPARGRLRADPSFGSAPARALVLHPDTVAEFEAMIQRRSAPPF